MSRLSRSAVYGALIAVLIGLGVISLAAGKIWIPWTAWSALNDDPRWIVVLELRLPRTLLGLMVGAALGVCGAVLQGYTRNPLADPTVLGVSSMAALGAVLTLYLGVAAAMPWVLPAGAMLGAAVGVGVLLVLAGATSSVLTFILAGAILNTVAAAGVSLALNLAPNPWAVNEIVNWLMGSVADRSIDDVRMALPFIAVGCVLLALTARALDALTLGETGAQSLGVRLDRVRLLIAVGVALAAGASVAVTGVIGFVGLVTPHLMRPLVGARPGALIVPSALAGAAIVLAADIIVRLTPSAAEVKLGVAMAALGGPFFLALLISMRRRMA
ncbi:MAG: iron ABC transporter permease [Rhodospirillaceae bacterium]|nr:iron ABC transporter permease [Rhodospirillaceae bacterium]